MSIVFPDTGGPWNCTSGEYLPLASDLNGSRVQSWAAFIFWRVLVCGGSSIEKISGQGFEEKKDLLRLEEALTEARWDILD